MINKKNLFKYFSNNVAYNLVFKVLNYNFENKDKTNIFMALLGEHLNSEHCHLDIIQKFLKDNSLKLCQEEGRVNGKILDIQNIIKDNFTNSPNSILDIGVGNGNVLTSVAESIGLDKDMLFGVDTVNYSKNNNFKHIEYDNHHIPLPSGSIDLTLIMMVLHHSNHPLSILKEAYRTLSDTGSVIIRETNAYSEDLLEFNILMEYVFYTILLEIPIHITDNYFPIEKWEKLFVEAGFNYRKLSEKSINENPFTAAYYILNK
jgi:ubiquinone/menaquinone biosynthesis C-methylase UbiE